MISYIDRSQLSHSLTDYILLTKLSKTKQRLLLSWRTNTFGLYFTCPCGETFTRSHHSCLLNLVPLSLNLLPLPPEGLTSLRHSFDLYLSKRLSSARPPLGPCYLMDYLVSSPMEWIMDVAACTLTVWKDRLTTLTNTRFVNLPALEDVHGDVVQGLGEFG